MPTGVAPRIMGIGPVVAIPAALKNCGLSLDDVDLFEVSRPVVACIMATNLEAKINEAFASQCVYTVKELGIPRDKVGFVAGDIKGLQLTNTKVNVNGGAIAIGHPLGCTGVRQVATGLHELERRQGRVLVTSMCIGTGMGAAAVFVRDRLF